MTIITETAHLILRELTDTNLDVIAAMHAQPEVMRYSPERRPLTREESAQFLAWVQDHYDMHGYGLWAVVEKASGVVIGYCGLTAYEIDGHAEVEAGYRLDPTYWGQGYATEAARACIEVAFTQIHVNRVISVTEAANTASVRVAEKNGMQWEQSLRIYDIPVEVYVLAKNARAS